MAAVFGLNTATDLHYHDEAAALSEPQPQTDHYLATDVREQPDGSRALFPLAGSDVGRQREGRVLVPV